MKPAALYLRTSTLAQMEKFGPTVQREAIERYAERMGLSITGNYEDAITGTRARREALDRLLTEAPRYEAVIISSVDRLARRVPVAYGVLAELGEAGLEVHAADMGLVDLEDESSGISFGFRTLMADSDHRRITRRMQAAKIAKVAGGVPVKPLSGYGWRDGVIDETEAGWVRWMFNALLHQGARTTAIELNALGVRTRSGSLWSGYSILNMVRNPVYKGEYSYGLSSTRRGTVKARCQVEGLVSPAVFDAAHEAIRHRHKNKGRGGSLQHLYPLLGRLTCGTCGRAIGGTINGRGSRRYYACNGRYLMLNPCPHRRGYPVAELHAAVRAALVSALGSPDDLSALLRPVPVTVPDVAGLRVAVSRRLSRLEAAYEAGAYTASEYAERRLKIKQENDALEQFSLPVQPPPDLEGARRQLSEALEEGNLQTLMTSVGARGVLHPDGRLALTLSPVGMQE